MIMRLHPRHSTSTQQGAPRNPGAKLRFLFLVFQLRQVLFPIRAQSGEKAVEVLDAWKKNLTFIFRKEKHISLLKIFIKWNDSHAISYLSQHAFQT